MHSQGNIESAWSVAIEKKLCPLSDYNPAIQWMIQ